MRLKTLVVVGLIGMVCGPIHAQKKIKDSVAYALGIQIGENLKQNNILDQLDLKTLMAALEGVKKGKTYMSKEKCDSTMKVFFTQRYEKIKLENAKKGEDFLARTKNEKDVVALPSGLLYKIVQTGEGPKPKATDEVEVNYKGSLIDGRVFDSSYDRGESIKFPLNRVIPGWTEGLQQVNEGGKIILYVPSSLAYGEGGMPNSIIEPNSTLIFEIELLKVKAVQAPMTFPALKQDNFEE